jgi:hypothetical protein
MGDGMDGLVWIEDKVDKNQICLVVNGCDSLVRYWCRDGGYVFACEDTFIPHCLCLLVFDLQSSIPILYFHSNHSIPFSSGKLHCSLTSHSPGTLLLVSTKTTRPPFHP